MEDRTSDNERTVEVKFVAHQSVPEELKVTETPFHVPVQLARLGLSGVINHLLALDPPKSFDFLIGNQFLRTSIEGYLQENGLSVETTVTIEYVEALNKPTHKESIKGNDWISAIDPANVPGFFITASYDNALRVFKKNNKTDNNNQTQCVLVCNNVHSSAIKHMKAFQIDTASFGILTASKDSTLKMVKVPSNDMESYQVPLVLKGHLSSVETLDLFPVSPNKLSVCSGSWDTTIRLWQVPTQQFEELPDQHDETTSNKKKAKQSQHKKRRVETREMSSSAIFTGHTGCVSAVAFSGSPNEIISASWDHSVRSWDVETSVNTNTLHSNEVAYSLSYNPFNNLIATGHSDRAIRMWDLRAKGSIVNQTLRSHKGWVSSVRWHPRSSHLFVSGSYDNTVKIWDYRASVPLYTLEPHHKDKVLCSEWDTEGFQVYSGGSDSVLNIWDMNLPTEENAQSTQNNNNESGNSSSKGKKNPKSKAQ